MKIDLKSGRSIEIDSIEDMKDLYGQLHDLIGDKVMIVKSDPVIIEKTLNDRLFPVVYPNLPMPKPLEVWCSISVDSD